MREFPRQCSSVEDSSSSSDVPDVSKVLVAFIFWVSRSIKKGQRLLSGRDTAEQIMLIYIYIYIYIYICKAVPLQAWSGPEDFRKLGFPDFMTTVLEGGKVVVRLSTLQTGRIYPQEILLVLISVSG